MAKYDAIAKEFDLICDIVAEYYDVSKDWLMVRNVADVVNARYSAICVMCESYLDFEVAKVSRLDVRTVNKIKNNVMSKQRDKQFYRGLEDIKKLFKTKMQQIDNQH